MELINMQSNKKTAMAKLNPPFRADQVGSLLRTTKVKENRLRWKRGEISADELREIENEV